MGAQLVLHKSLCSFILLLMEEFSIVQSALFLLKSVHFALEILFFDIFCVVSLIDKLHFSFILINIRIRPLASYYPRFRKLGSYSARGLWLVLGLLFHGHV